jgi:hypothetical protein
MLFIVRGERGLGRREIGDIRIEGQHGSVLGKIGPPPGTIAATCTFRQSDAAASHRISVIGARG